MTVQIDRRRRFILALAPILVVTWLIAPSAPGRYHVVEIEADHSAGAESGSVAIARLSAGGEDALQNIVVVEGWMRHDGILTALPPPTKVLRWEGLLDEPALLELVVAPDAGRARVIVDGREQRLDLRSARPGRLLVPIAGTRPRRMARRDLPGWMLWLAAVLGRGAIIGGVVLLLIDTRARALVGRDRPWWVDPLVSVAGSCAIAPAVARFLGSQGGPWPLEILAAWMWGVLAVWTAIVLMAGPAQPPPVPRWMRSLAHAPIFDRPRTLLWLIALIACPAATFLTLQLRPWSSRQAARWARIEVDGGGFQPAFVRLVDADTHEELTPFSWRPTEQTAVAIRLRETGGPRPRLVSLVANGEAIDIHTMARRGVSAANEMDDSGVAIFTIPTAARDLTITLAGGRGTADIFWLDQKTSVALGSDAASAHLALPSGLIGWTLVQPHQSRALALRIPPDARDLRLRRLDLLSPRPDLPTLPVREWTSRGGCVVAKAADGWTISSGSQSCDLVPDWHASVDPPDRARTVITWLALSLTLSGTLWILLRLGERFAWLRTFDAALLPRIRPVSLASDGRWLRGFVLVGGAALLMAVLYATCMPLDVLLDSQTYVDLGRAFSQRPVLDTQNTFRTPGYPMFLALIFDLFGERGPAIALVQQGLVSALAPLTYWALTARGASIRLAMMVSLLVALSPVLRPVGNVPLTETPFAFVSCAAFLVFALWGPTRRGLILCGVLAGLATLLRPNGLAVLMVIGAWIALCGWFIARNVRSLVPIASRLAWLVAGYLVVAAPWHAHLYLARGTTDISQGSARFVLWLSGALQGWIDEDVPVNLPHRAIWVASQHWAYDGWHTVNDFPETWSMTGHPLGIWLMIPPRDQFVAARALSATWFQESSDEGAWIHGARRQAMRMNIVRYLFSLRPQPGLRTPGDETIMLNHWRASRWAHPAAAPGSPEAALQALMRPYFDVPWSPARRALQWMVDRWWAGWRYLSFAALAGLCLLVIRREPWSFVLIPAGLFWLGQIASSAMIGWPVDRYIACTEPLLHILAALGLASVWHAVAGRFVKTS
jgi:hypothetical protein